MATKKTTTEAASARGILISEERHTLATKATWEICQAAAVLREAIIELNAESSIPVLWAPALLRRIELLSNSTCDCLGTGEWDEAELTCIIEEGASHV